MKSLFGKVIQFCGVQFGRILRHFPQRVKFFFARALTVGTLFSPRFSNFLFLFSFALVKKMFDGADGAFIRRAFKDGFVMDLDVSQKTQRSLAYLRDYEEPVSSFLRKTLMPGDVFIDVGANTGYYTLLAATRVGSVGRVIGFEPEAHNFELLSRNLALNTFPHIEVHRVALSDMAGTATLHLNPLNEGGHSLAEFHEYRDSHERWSVADIEKKFPGKQLSETVPVMTLDAFLKQERLSRPVSAMKIDVESFELPVLRGMLSELAENQALKIVCEVTEHQEEVMKLMRDHGFKVYILLPGGKPKEWIQTDSRIPKFNYLFAKII